MKYQLNCIIECPYKTIVSSCETRIDTLKAELQSRRIYFPNEIKEDSSLKFFNSGEIIEFKVKKSIHDIEKGFTSLELKVVSSAFDNREKAEKALEEYSKKYEFIKNL